MNIDSVRINFASLLEQERFVIDKTGVKTIELTGVSFVASDNHIFGAPNVEYIARELEWYYSKSLKIDNFPGGAPEIWQRTASVTGFINSNYGWMVFSPDNCSQYVNVLGELKKNPFSRRAVAVYTRPNIWSQYNTDGMSDFICTNAVQYLIRDGYLEVIVQMRSNDAWAGYRNDYAWQKHVQEKMARELHVEPGEIIWQVGSLHVYEQQFYLVDWYSRTGQTHVGRKTYAMERPNSQWIIK